MSEDDHLNSESILILDNGIPMLLSNFGVKKFDFSFPHYALAPSVVFRAESLTELYLSECKFMSTNHDQPQQPLFKCLKRLSLNKVEIDDEMLEKIVCSCPLIEYLLVSACVGLRTIPLTLFQAEEFLEELHLSGSNLIIDTFSSTDEPLSIKRLKKLSLTNVNILDETLDKIMCSCPLIEHLVLSHCVQFTPIQLNQYQNYRTPSRFIPNRMRAPIIKTICPNWYGQDKYFFPRLKSLHLYNVNMSSFPDFVNCLFLICRPKYIGMNWYNITAVADSKKEKKYLDEFILSQIIQNQGEMSRGYLWEQDLEEMSMQVRDENSQGWHTIRIEGASFLGFTPSDLKIRFQVKWRD